MNKSIPLNELISEHERLVRVLKSGDKTKITNELHIQEMELNRYLKDKKR
jgi:hypothetical protein